MSGGSGRPFRYCAQRRFVRLRNFCGWVSSSWQLTRDMCHAAWGQVAVSVPAEEDVVGLAERGASVGSVGQGFVLGEFEALAADGGVGLRERSRPPGSTNPAAWEEALDGRRGVVNRSSDGAWGDCARAGRVRQGGCGPANAGGSGTWSGKRVPSRAGAGDPVRAVPCWAYSRDGRGFAWLGGAVEADNGAAPWLRDLFLVPEPSSF